MREISDFVKLPDGKYLLENGDIVQVEKVIGRANYEITITHQDGRVYQYFVDYEILEILDQMRGMVKGGR